MIHVAPAVSAGVRLSLSLCRFMKPTTWKKGPLVKNLAIVGICSLPEMLSVSVRSCLFSCGAELRPTSRAQPSAVKGGILWIRCRFSSDSAYWYLWLTHNEPATSSLCLIVSFSVLRIMFILPKVNALRARLARCRILNYPGKLACFCSWIDYRATPLHTKKTYLYKDNSLVIICTSKAIQSLIRMRTITFQHHPSCFSAASKMDKFAAMLLLRRIEAQWQCTSHCLDMTT